MRLGRRKQSPANNLLDCLQKHKLEALAIMVEFRIPFDNNLAERDLSLVLGTDKAMVKVKQKVSNAICTVGGAKTLCAICRTISTVRKQGGNVIGALQAAFDENVFMRLAFAT
jgi:transposase